MSSANVAVMASMNIPPAGSGTLVIANAWKNSATASSCAITVSPAAGSLLCVFSVEYNGTTNNPSISDNIDSTTGWTLVDNQLASGLNLICWYKKNCPSGITTITITGSTAVAFITGIVHEGTGFSTSAPFTSGETSKNTGTSANPQSPTITNATAASAYFSCCADFSGQNPCQFTVNSTGSTGGTWTNFSTTNSRELNGVANNVCSVASLVVSSSSGRVHGVTLETSLQYLTLTAVFH